MPLNEADTRAVLIEPKLKTAGWSDSLITREHFYRRDHRYTVCRIYLVGDDARRREPRRVDYLLRYIDAFPIAVVEAKDEGQAANAGLEQAKRYARDLTLHCLNDQYGILALPASTPISSSRWFWRAADAFLLCDIREYEVLVTPAMPQYL